MSFQPPQPPQPPPLQHLPPPPPPPPGVSSPTLKFNPYVPPPPTAVASNNAAAAIPAYTAYSGTYDITSHRTPPQQPPLPLGAPPPLPPGNGQYYAAPPPTPPSEPPGSGQYYSAPPPTPPLPPPEPQKSVTYLYSYANPPLPSADSSAYAYSYEYGSYDYGYPYDYGYSRSYARTGAAAEQSYVAEYDSASKLSSKHLAQKYRTESSSRSSSVSYGSHSQSSAVVSRERYQSSSYSSYPARPRREREVVERPRPKQETERDRLLKNWRAQYCETSEDIARKLAELAELNEDGTEVWVRSSPADLFYKRTSTVNEVESTTRLDALCKLFQTELLERAERVRATLPPYVEPPRKPKRRLCKHKSEACSSSSDDSSDDEFKVEQDCCMEELSRKLQHPHRVHADLWHNDVGEMNDGPLCRCSAKSRRIGIRHGIYPGENGISKCIPNSNNATRLYHYRIAISPPTNFLTKTPTLIKHDEHEFLFEGFSLLSHEPLGELPTCKVIRFNIEYTILYIEEKMPENFTIRELELFTKYLFHELLELVDFTLIPSGHAEDSCPAFHFLPRFVRDLPDNGKEFLAMCEVLKYLLDNSGPLVERSQLLHMKDMSQHEWQDYVDYIKGMLVTKPGYKPCSVRVDQLDRNVSDLPECYDEDVTHPAIVHFGIRPPQLSYAGNPEYQRAWREYVKFRHLMANMSKPSYKDKRKLQEKETRLQEMRTQGRMKRNITVAVSSKGYRRTGIMCDVVQHAMLIPVLTGHLRFHKSLNFLEDSIGYKFHNRYLLQLALTHPSYKENYGTNPDHARNSLTNCGIRQPEYGDRKIHYMNTRKRGINTLINIMSRFGKEYETMSNITHNERLEFLGDAVVEFLSSIHLFFMFPELEEGGLATYRAAIVQNQHLALLAKKLHLEEYMLYAHGSDLCHELELRHAMANCFEALMGALLLDGGISVADNVFINALFLEDEKLKEIWKNYPKHPLQEQEPMGDRHFIASYPVLQELNKFEDSIGIEFKHIRLLARAFTDRSIGFTHLTLGSNQRLEFLGDTVLQLICSEYLYRHFPEHHEGHLSLLRSSLVNNRTQAVVCDDLGMTKYAVYSNPKADLKTKDRADLLEAFLGALYVDKGLMYCEQFCHICLFPRLQMFIMNQDWNDPKSKLQQCCLTLRTMDGGEPDIPIYKVIESIGPTNTRVYTVAVYFRSKRLATATGQSIQQAEMNAAKQALENSRDLFPQLDHQKRVIAESIKKQIGTDLKPDVAKIIKKQHRKRPAVAPMEDESHLPKQYREREDISSDELPEYELDESFTEPARKSSLDDSETSTEPSIAASPAAKRRRRRKNVPSSSNETTPETTPLKSQPSAASAAAAADLLSYNKICEEVSSDECFASENESPRQAETTNGTSKETKPKTVENGGGALLADLKDLVEDVSSASDLESGELSA